MPRAQQTTSAKSVQQVPDELPQPNVFSTHSDLYSSQADFLSHDVDEPVGKDVEGKDNPDQPPSDKLPLEARQKGTWWSMAAGVFLANMGVASLTFPYAMASMTWVGGIIAGGIAYFASFYTLYLMLDLHVVGDRRFNRYRELGEFAFGRVGRFLVAVVQYSMAVGINIAYTLLAGQAAKAFYDELCSYGSSCPPYGQSAWITTIGAIVLLLCFMPDMSSLNLTSALGTVTTIGYTAVIVGASIAAGLKQEKATGHHAEWNLDGRSHVAGILGAWAALGTLIYPYGTHIVALEMQAQIPEPSFRPAFVGSALGYGLAGVCLFITGFAGYWAFGADTSQTILFGSTVRTKAAMSGSIPGPRWVLALGDILVVASLLLQFQLFMMPTFDAIEGALRRHVKKVNAWMRYGCRIGFVVGITIVAISLPFFGDIIALIGALSAVPDAYIVPAWTYQRVRKPPKSDWRFWANWAIIYTGFLVMVLAAVAQLERRTLTGSHSALLTAH
ncbi:hypothetical protein WJX84_001624 [Apatococcus fuscideae]|uniref:Amino acid transporter transmembrane domain-containing protein n=1 Tax=Apatococcus fuscideae TaxID=2026836 RepID=A0AAW1SXH1_9CHLO